MLKKVLKYIFITIILFSVIICFSFRPIKIEGNSMYPSLKHGDWVLINKAAYIFLKPKRGDIIIFDLANQNRKYMIKRIIGLEKETIEIKFGRVYINNYLLSHFYLDYSISDNFYKRIIPQNSFFVLGDNRRVSIDSRYREVGFINKQHIIGKIIFKW